MHIAFGRVRRKIAGLQTDVSWKDVCSSKAIWFVAAQFCGVLEEIRRNTQAKTPDATRFITPCVSLDYNKIHNHIGRGPMGGPSFPEFIILILTSVAGAMFMAVMIGVGIALGFRWGGRWLLEEIYTNLKFEKWLKQVLNASEKSDP